MSVVSLAWDGGSWQGVVGLCAVAGRKAGTTSPEHYRNIRGRNVYRWLSPPFFFLAVTSYGFMAYKLRMIEELHSFVLQIPTVM